MLLVAGAELFVDNVAGAARRLGITVLAVGLLLAGAEPEELLTGVIAALRDRPALAVGDAIGANLTMLTGTLGLAALARPLPFGRRVRCYAVLSTVAGGLAVASLADGRVSRVEGGLLLLGYGVLVGVIWWRERQPPMLGELAEVADEVGEHGSRLAGQRAAGRGPHPASGRSASLGLLLAVVGILVMLAGGDVAVAGAARVVTAFGQTDSAVGLTVLALATTAELFALVWAAARRGTTEIAVAGVVGSAAYNATATLGAAALARPLAVGPALVVPAAAAAALPLVVAGLAVRGQLGRLVGAVLVLGYLGYLLAVLR